jgi:hypothetical protein
VLLAAVPAVLTTILIFMDQEITSVIVNRKENKLKVSVNKNLWWLVLLAAVPALLTTILILLDQQITSVIVNRKENKLKVGNMKNKCSCSL